MQENRFDIDLNGLEVLVVEDDSASARILARALTKYGARVDVATNGRSALAKFQEHRFPLVITDINMPGMSGLELAERIKSHDRNTHIIATSVNDETDCLITALELGFSDYFLKPFSVKKLLGAVKKCIHNITLQKQLANEQRKLETVLECLGEGITIKDMAYRILYQNRAMTEMFGDRIGTPCYELFGRSDICEECPTVQTLIDGQNHSSCLSYRRNGATTHVESTTSLMKDSDGTVTGTVEVIRDISERIRNEQTIREMAFLDPLTGLSNRRLFRDRLEQAIAKSRRYGSSFGLLSLDLDNFKDINDSFGHEGGDQVLVEAGERIRSCCKRDLDTVSRQGGDEFCIIIADCGDRAQLGAIADKLLKQFSLPFSLADTKASVTVSIGISLYPEHGSDMKELEIASDRAMYAAKKAGRNRYVFWEAPHA